MDAPSSASRWWLPTLVSYRREWLIPDIVAGLSAGAVVVPQAMAYATIANLPVQVGLYTCILPMLVYALLGGSRAMSVSTTSTIATLTATTFVSVGVAQSSADPLGSLVSLSLLVGGFLMIGRLLRLGSVVENISEATVLGIKIGVGATVAVGQIPKLLGEDIEVSGGGFVRALLAIGGAFGDTNLATLAVSIGSIVVLVVIGRWAPRFPATLLVVAGGIGLVALSDVEALGVALIAPVPAGLPVPQLPALTHMLDLVPAALAIALMSFMESASVAQAIRTRDEPQIDSDQELLATGAANMVGSFFATIPAAGGFSQSAVNRAAGARTQMAGMVTVGLAILVALFLGPILSLMPQATLAAMVFVAVAALIDIPRLLLWARVSPVDFWVALFVAVVGLSLGLLVAVAVGVGTTLVLVLREINVPRLEISGRRAEALAVHVGRGLYTANVAANTRAILALVQRQDPTPRVLIVDLVRQEVITITILDALEELDRELAARGVQLQVCALPPAAAKVASRISWFRRLDAAGRVHDTPEEALEVAGRSPA